MIDSRGMRMKESNLALAVQQIKFAREYTCSLLADITDEEWFVIPAGAPTHIAWQVGHLAMAQYGLTLLRIRGKEPEDAEFITNDFIRLFKKQSTPVADPKRYPSPREIREVLANVHDRSLAELEGYDDAALAEQIPEPYAVFNTKLGSVLFCSAHELIHAGQIGLLRRLLGKAPVR